MCIRDRPYTILVTHTLRCTVNKLLFYLKTKYQFKLIFTVTHGMDNDYYTYLHELIKPVVEKKHLNLQ